MVINAKFASFCPCCSARIEVGSKIEWSRGEKAKHVACVGTPVALRRAPVSPRIQTTSRRGRAWRPCGYPGCNSAYCDECEGEGNRGAYSFDS